MIIKFILPILSIFVISFFVFYPSFKLALFGDDWLAFFRYAQHLGPESPGTWNHLSYYLTPYGPQDILMGLLRKFFGFDSTPYFIFSFSFRMIAAISFYPLVYYLTKSKVASMFAVLFFSVTATGLDTTNWVFNMPSYITVALFNLCLLFFIIHRQKGGVKLLLLAAIFYYLAYITTPIRMHGSLIFLFILEAFYIFQERTFKVTKKALLRFGVMLAVFLIVRYTGTSQGPMVEASERFNLGLKAMSEMFSQGRFDFVFYPLIMFGGALIPDFILPSIQVISKSRLLMTNLIPSLLVFSIFIFLLTTNIAVSKMNFLKRIVLTSILWVAVVIITFHFNLKFLNDSRFIYLLLIGGFAVSLVGSLIIQYFKQKNIATAFFLGLAWSVCSFFFAWWWVPASLFPTTYRYLIVTAVGVTIILATIISLGKSKQSQGFLFALFCSLIVIHIIATQIYLNFLVSSHGRKISDKLWSNFPHIEELGKTRDPLIFYFEGDDTNGTILHDVITFGFPPHMALLYGIREEDGGIPIPMSDPKELVSAVTDGKAARAYGYPEKPVPIERVYGFKLQGMDNLINITPQLREKLLEIKSNAQVQK